MKIAFLAYDLSEKNGWGRYAAELLKRLPSHGVEPVVLAIRGADPHPDLSRLPFHPVLRSYEDDWRKPWNLLRDISEVSKWTRDCEQIHSLVEPYLWTASALAGRHRPLHVSVHGTYSVRIVKGLWRKRYAKAYAACDNIFAVSRYTAGRVAAEVPAASTRIRVIPNGVAFPLHRISAQNSPRERAFLTVGAVKPRKGVLEAVKALALVASDFPDVKLYVVGSAPPGPYVDAVKAEALRLAVSDRVIWKGKIPPEELEDLYGRVRGLAMPSINEGGSFEGFGLVHLEANTFGLPAIGSLECGNEEAIRDGVTGFLVPQRDIPAIAQAMRSLLEPASDWERMSIQATAFARSMDWTAIARKYADAYFASAGIGARWE